MPEIIKVNRDWIKRQIDSARVSIGRDVTFYTTDRAACYLCTASGFINTNTHQTVYFNCPVCDGQSYTYVTSGHTILARVHWVNDEAITATPGGKYYIGEATLHIEPKYLSVAQQSQDEGGSVMVDDHEMQVTKIIPLGAPDPNRYRVILKNTGARPE